MTPAPVPPAARPARADRLDRTTRLDPLDRAGGLDPTEVMSRLSAPPPRPRVMPPRRSRRQLRILAVLGGLLVVGALATAVPSTATGPSGRSAGAAPRAAPAREAIGAIGAISAVGAIAITPNVIGRPVADAGATLIAAGYRSPISWRADPAAAGSPCAVVRQDPPAGSPFRSGAAATLVVVRGSCR